jgi:hypothetical protein
VTAPQGELDVETWSTFAPQGEVDGGPSSRGVREMVELEYGITDRWDAALYNMLDMITSGNTSSGYAGLMIETRYRPSDRGEWPVDPVLYFEFQQLFRGDARQKYEAKLILAKDLGNVNFAANARGGRGADDRAGVEHRGGEYALGTSHALSPAWMIGVEPFGASPRRARWADREQELGRPRQSGRRGRGVLRGSG